MVGGGIFLSRKHFMCTQCIQFRFEFSVASNASVILSILDSRWQLLIIILSKKKSPSPFICSHNTQPPFHYATNEKKKSFTYSTLPSFLSIIHHFLPFLPPWNRSTGCIIAGTPALAPVAGCFSSYLHAVKFFTLVFFCLFQVTRCFYVIQGCKH